MTKNLTDQQKIENSLHYLARMIFFLTVPGVHLISFGSKKFGWFLFGVAAFANIFLPIILIPFAMAISLGPDFIYSGKTYFLTMSISWIVILLDIKNLKQRQISRPSKIVAVCLLLFGGFLLVIDLYVLYLRSLSTT